MYYVVDHKPQDELEEDLQKKYGHLVRNARKNRTAHDGFRKVCLERQKEGALDELLKRGNNFNAGKRLEFDGPRSRNDEGASKS